MRGRLDQLRQCLVGWWGFNSAHFPELEYVRSWALKHWALKGNLRVAVLGRGLLLFDFESPSEAERVLARGLRNIKENVIILDRWNLEVGCLCKDSIANEVWVRAVGLPLHLWSTEVFKRISDGCEGFAAVDEDSVSLSELQWARILVKRANKEFPNFAHIVVGSGCYSFQLWWESSPWFTQVVPVGSLDGEGDSRVGEEDGGTSCAFCCGSQREKVEQLRMQQGVLDVSSIGGVLSIPPTVVFGAETVVEGRVGTTDGHVKGGRETSFKRTDVSVLGLKGLRFGLNVLELGETQGPLKELGEPQGPLKEIQEGLGQDSRPNDLIVVKGCREGATRVGLRLEGSDAVGGGFYLGKSLLSLVLGHKV